MKKVTKKVLTMGEALTKEHGYWSQEVCSFISQFENYEQRQKLHKHLRNL